MNVRSAATAAAMLGVALSGACARQGAPPGGPEDRRPPVVVATSPDTFAVLTEPFRGPVVFRFDERISERIASGTLEDAVLVSPRTGEVRVEAGRDRIEVTVAGGFQPGRVYRVRLLPVVRDMFNNTLRAPVELVFSTGGELTQSAVAGLVWDRTTGQGAADLSVTALSEDSTLYVSETDSAGIYALRYLPVGRYQIRAWEDRNRNDVIDRMETQGARAVLLSGADTLLLDVPVLQPDTTPAMVTRVDVLDSVTFTIGFDDFLDPSISAAQPSVALRREEGEAPALERVFHEGEYEEWLQYVTDSVARLDSLAAARAARAAEARVDSARGIDTARVSDTLQAPARDTLRVSLPALRPARRGLPPPLPAEGGQASMAARARSLGVGAPPTTPDGSPLPGRRLVVRLAAPLEPNAGYQVEVRGVTNLNGIPLGGGESAVVFTPPRDTANVSDTAGDTIPPDTGAAVPDTVPPDTGAAAGARARSPRSLLPFLSGPRR